MEGRAVFHIRAIVGDNCGEIVTDITPTVDGEELPKGFGIIFEQTEHPLAWMHSQNIHGSQVRLPLILCAWVTRQDTFTGKYEKYYEVTGHRVRVWDERGRAWEYDGKELKIIEDNLDLEKEYGDE